MKLSPFLTLLAALAFAGTASAQQKMFEWQPANDEAVRLDPANYHTARTYRPGPQGGNIHVDIEAQQPVTIFLTGEGEWNQALQYPETIATLRKLCLREHVVKTTYLCDLPAEPMTLVVRDDRGSAESAAFAGLGEVLKRDSAVLNNPRGDAISAGVGLAAILKKEGSPTRRFKSPNDVHIQYYRWACISNCFPPQFQWIQQAKEKFELTSFLKVYGGYTPGRDGEVVSIKIKAPVPMLVAVVPSSVANQLHAKPEMLEPALEKNSCQQRGVQSQTFQCTFNAADGPQSLIVVPEETGKVPHKKAEIEFFASKCVANCALPAENANSSAEKINP
ncbi:MAG TPA: hypothetical protein VN943_17965 [Candidatus Acidoferrum sp.]|nr:hypothetical protein [Candidatus Acidoferrum sp.]